ncbi:MAG: hypothetical protein R6W99_06315 [Clostridia bacterium]
MNKKILLLALFLLFFLLFSCVGKEKPYVVEKPLFGMGENVYICINDENVFELTSASSFFYSLETPGDKEADEACDDWYKVIESTFNIELNILSVYRDYVNQKIYLPQYSAKEVNYIMSSIENDDIKGLFQVRNIQLLQKLIDEGAVLPMENYLDENNNWSNLPYEWKNAYSDGNNIWALPTRYEQSISFRLIRNDWLSAINMESPVSIIDFYEVLYNFTYNNPDKDSVNNTSGAICNGLSGLEDIFASFDARLTPDGKVTPVWNPNKNIWEDSFIKPEFSECMQFLLKCIDEKVIVNSIESRIGKDFIEGYSGSFYTQDELIDIEESIHRYRPETTGVEIGSIIGLTHNISENVTCAYTTFSYPIVLTKNSNQPSSTMNIYIDFFISNIDGYLLGRYGLQDKSYYLDNNAIVYKTKNDTGEKTKWPGIVANSPVFIIEQIPESQLAEKITENTDRLNVDELVEQSLLCYKFPWNQDFLTASYETERMIRALENVSQRIANEILLGVVPIEDGVERYRDIAKSLDVQQYLNILNNRLENNDNPIN